MQIRPLQIVLPLPSNEWLFRIKGEAAEGHRNLSRLFLMDAIRKDLCSSAGWGRETWYDHVSDPNQPGGQRNDRIKAEKCTSAAPNK